MRHRIFIAINLPEDIKKQLISFGTQLQGIPARWTGKDNLHVTLVFLGYLSDDELLAVCKATEKTALRHNQFDIRFTKICYGPPKKIPPRMVWVQGEKSKELAGVKQDLEGALAGPAAAHFTSEERLFAPHITLARIKTWEWRKFEPEERPEINEEIDLSFEVNSIDIMESRLKKKGAEYEILESVPLSE